MMVLHFCNGGKRHRMSIHVKRIVEKAQTGLNCMIIMYSLTSVTSFSLIALFKRCSKRTLDATVLAPDGAFAATTFILSSVCAFDNVQEMKEQKRNELVQSKKSCQWLQ